MHRALRHSSPHRRAVPLLALAVAGATAVAGCSRGAEATAAPSRLPATAAAQQSAKAGSAHGAHSEAAAAATLTGAALGLRIQTLLAHHAVLAADMMRARMRNAPDTAQAADAALGKNTQALGSLMDGLLGPQNGTKFSRIWAEHLRGLFAYADALANHDDAALAKAKARLQPVVVKMASYLSKSAKGKLPAATARAAVRGWLNKLLAQADAFAAERYQSAAVNYQAGYNDAFALGGALGTVLLPKSAVTQLKQSRWQLRATLTNQLGDHVALVVAAMRASNGAAADFKAITRQLDKNTVALASSIDSLFGSAAAHRFQNLWSDHIDSFALYTSSTIKGDAAGQARANAQLKTFEHAFSTFLARAVGSRITASALAQAFAEHDQMLTEVAKAYHAKDYSKAHELSYQAYLMMYDLSAQLSNAVGDALAARRPHGGSQTGGGGMATAVGRR